MPAGAAEGDVLSALVQTGEPGMEGTGEAFGSCKTCVFVLERIKKGSNMLLPAICSELYHKYPDAYALCHQVLNALSINGNNVRYWLFEGPAHSPSDHARARSPDEFGSEFQRTRTGVACCDDGERANITLQLSSHPSQTLPLPPRLRLRFCCGLQSALVPRAHSVVFLVLCMCLCRLLQV